MFERGLVPHNTVFKHGFNLSKWQEQMTEATAIMRKSGRVMSTDAMNGVAHTHGYPFHLSFNYFCCYTPSQWSTIKDVLMVARVWTHGHEVTWDKVVCRIDGPSNHISLILLADRASNKRLMRWIGDVEALITRAGVPVHVSRSEQQPFHVTLGVVDGSSGYPVDTTIDEINSKLRGKWEGIVLPHHAPLGSS